MIKVFSPTDKVFYSNGDVVVKATSAKVHCEDNGDYYIEIIAGIEYSEWLVARNIVVAPTPDGDQPFRLEEPEKSGTKITIKGWHVFYDTQNYLIADSYVVDKNCNDALNHLNDATEPESIFTVHSDIAKIDSYRCVREPLYNAIQVVLERYGGHLVRNGFDIGILENIGHDNGITIEYKKNLKDIESSGTWENVCTKILPVGTDGLLLNALDPNESIYIESEIQYDTPYTKTVTFDQNIERENYSTDNAYKRALLDDLRAQAIAYLKIYSVPEISYSLKADLDRITGIGDTIEVKDKRIGVDVLTHVIGYTYDCILKKYDEIDFGNFQQNLSNLLSDISAQIDTKVDEVKNSINQSVEEILQGSYVYNNGREIYLLDNLPKEDAGNVLKLDRNGISSSNQGISSEFTQLIDIAGNFTALEYVFGDEISFNGQIVAGYSTSNNTTVNFVVRTDKSLANIDAFTASSMKLTGRVGEGGYLFSSSYVTDGYDILNDATLTVTLTKLSDHAIAVSIVKDSGSFYGVTNMANTILINDMVIVCTSA